MAAFVEVLLFVIIPNNSSARFRTFCSTFYSAAHGEYVLVEAEGLALLFAFAFHGQAHEPVHEFVEAKPCGLPQVSKNCKINPIIAQMNPNI